MIICCTVHCASFIYLASLPFKRNFIPTRHCYRDYLQSDLQAFVYAKDRIVKERIYWSCIDHKVELSCVEIKRPSQQFFCHVGMEPPLPGYNHFFRGVKCPAQGHTAEVDLASEPDTLPLSPPPSLDHIVHEIMSFFFIIFALHV